MTISRPYLQSIQLKDGHVFGVWAAILISAIFNWAHAAQLQEGKPDLRFEKVPHEMVASQISDIEQDSFGFLWVGTNSGLSRFDGVNVRNYKNSDLPHSLPSDNIGAVFEDGNRNIWIGGYGVMARYRWETDDFSHYELPDTLSRLTTLIQSIVEDSEGNIWISGGSSGLYYYEPLKNEFIAYYGLETSAVNTILPGDNGVIWMTTRGDGVHRLDTQTGEITIYRHNKDDPNSLSSDMTNSIVRDHHGDYWIGSREGGITRMTPDKQNPDSARFKRYFNEPGSAGVLSNNHVYTLYIDNEGQLWAGNENGGIHLYDRENDTFHHYDSDPDDPFSLSHNSVLCLFQDKNSRLWIGTALSGLNILDSYAIKFEHHHTRSRFTDRVSNNVIRDFNEDNDGNIWIATDGGGLNYFNRSTDLFTTFRHDPEDPQSISSDAVISLRRDPNGLLWVGTYNGGLDLLVDESKGTFVSAGDTLSLPEDLLNTTFDVYFDSHYPYIWIAEMGEGVFRYNYETGGLQELRPEMGDDQSLSSSYVMRIVEDSEKNLWFVSLNGLSMLSKENRSDALFKTYFHEENDPESLSSNRIQQVFEDSRGNVWVATISGLSRFVPETDRFENYDESDGLLTNDLRSIAEDENGHLWIGSAEGLSRMDPDTGQIQNFTRDDGLQRSEFSRYSAILLSTGELAFGGLNGFNLFHPDQIRANPHVPDVYITGFWLFNQQITPQSPDSPLDQSMILTDTVRLSHNENVFTFEFVALNYTLADQNEYAYMMEGFDSEWNYSGNFRSATYTNLDPGTYRFRVRASNNDGLWNEEGASVAVIIVPPFWQTYWFYGLAIFFTVIIVTAAVRLKINSIRNRQRELEEVVEKRTTELRKSNQELNQMIAESNRVYSVLGHDLRNPFMSIIGYSEYLQEKFEDDPDNENREIMNIILQAARNTFNLLENLLKWAGSKGKATELVRQSVNLNDVAEEVKSTIGVQAKIKGISIYNNIDPELTAFADSDMIQTVLRNLVSNAIKFSPENTRVIVRADDHGDELLVSVQDFGIGMSTEEAKNIFSVSSGKRKKGTSGEKGTGLGLMLSKDFVEKNGGKIWVESKRDEGSTFWFTVQKYTEAKKMVS